MKCCTFKNDDEINYLRRSLELAIKKRVVCVKLRETSREMKSSKQGFSQRLIERS